MLPEVANLLSLDVYRDGGSLSASFSDETGTQHELVFFIDNTYDVKDKVKKYRAAVIVSFYKSDYVSPVTGLATEMIDKKDKNISWQEAVSLLNQIEPFIHDFKSEYLWIFKSMAIVSGNEKHEINYS